MDGPLRAAHGYLAGTFSELLKLVVNSSGEEQRRLVDVAKLITQATRELIAIAHDQS